MGEPFEAEVTTDLGTLRAVSVHSPAIPIRTGTLQDAEVASIKLANNPHLWFTEILWSLLRDSNTPEETN